MLFCFVCPGGVLAAHRQSDGIAVACSSATVLRRIVASELSANKLFPFYFVPRRKELASPRRREARSHTLEDRVFACITMRRFKNSDWGR